MIGRIIAAAFHFRFIALAVDVIDRRGPSNESKCVCIALTWSSYLVTEATFRH